MSTPNEKSIPIDNSQPAQQPIIQQPAPLSQPAYSPANPSGKQEWQNGFFDCFSPFELCLKATFCPCFVYGKTSTRLVDPTLSTYDHFNGECFTWLAIQYCCAAGGLYQFFKRREIREKYGLEGNDVTDCLGSCFCHCCALMQQEKEVEAREGLLGNGAAQGYQKNPGMNVPGN